MLAFPVVVAVPAVPVSAAATEAALSGDWQQVVVQLGVGGVLVVFGAAIYRRFEQRADGAAITHKQEIAALESAHAVALKEERDRHDETRRLYIAALQARPD